MSAVPTQNVLYGVNALSILSQRLNEIDAKSVLIVHGGEAYELCGAREAMITCLSGVVTTEIGGFEPNPKSHDLARYLEQYDMAAFDAIIAVGGGSVMDMAKLLKVFGRTPDKIAAHLLEGEAIEPMDDVPFFAVPTTAGSGSESTPFAVLYHDGVKFSVAHDSLLPEIAIVVPEFLQHVPQAVAAATGMDVLCQGIESYWSIHSNDTSSDLAVRAIKLALEHLEPAIVEQELESIAEMGRAANLAGQAISFTKTTAAHAVSYVLTSRFGVPHGHAVGLMLAPLVSYNAAVTDEDTLDARGAEFVTERMSEICGFLGTTDPDDAGARVAGLMHRLGLETSLPALGIASQDDIEIIVNNGFNPQRVNNNPRRLTENALRGILQQQIERGRA